MNIQRQPIFNPLKHPNIGFRGRGKSHNPSEWIKKVLDKGNSPVIMHGEDPEMTTEEQAKETCDMFKERFGKELTFDILVGGVLYSYRKDC